MKKSILITWWTSYLGEHILEAIYKIDMDIKIVVLTRDIKNAKEKLYKVANYSSISFYSIDDIQKAFEENQVTHVVHTATNYGRWWQKVSSLVESNTLYPLKLLEVSMDFWVSYFINTDTSLEKEISLYARTKKNFIEYAKKIIEGKNIHFINLKLEHFYWPNESGEKFIPFLLKKLEKDEAIDLTAGEQKRDFIYIDDLTYIYEKLLSTWLQNKKDNFLEYQVGTWRSYTIRFVVEKLKELMQSKSQLNFWKIPYRDGESMFSQADISELKKIIDFSPKVNLEEGLKKVVFSYKDN